MGNLRYRKYLNILLPKHMINILYELKRRTNIPISRLAEEAFYDLFQKKEYRKLVKEIEKDLPEE